jgi:nicotinamide-nucleotide amidase
MKPVGTVVFARARRGADPKEIVADLKDFGDLGRGGIRLQAALCALELLMPVAEAPSP